MYRIGQFSILSKVTIKTLRFYEAEGLLKPSFIDRDTGYRYYEASQLVDISKIISLRQIGLSISDIKRVLSGGDVKEIFEQRKREIEDNIRLEYSQLSKINYLLEDNMENQIVFKELPGGIVYYKEGMIKDYSEIAMFVLQAGEECQKINPTLKCVEPGYCYVNYLDGEYKEKDIKVRYAEMVTEMGISDDKIGFMGVKSVEAVCLYHRGSYDNLRESYSIIMEYIEKNGLEITDFPRECYIDGCWNKSDEKDYLTEIQIPVVRK